MPSVGSLLISIKAETESLRSDLAKGMSKIDAFTRSGVASGQKVSSGFDKIGLSGEKLGRSLGRVVTGTLMMTGAMDKAGPVGEAVANTLGAFLAGGPIAAGIVGVTSLFKLLAGAESDADKAAKKARDTTAEWMKSLRDGADDANKAVLELTKSLEAEQFKVVGIDLSADRLALLGTIRKKLEAAERQEGVVAKFGTDNDITRLAGRENRSTASFVEFVNARKRERSEARDALAAMMAEIAALEAQLATLRSLEQAKQDVETRKEAKDPPPREFKINSRDVGSGDPFYEVAPGRWERLSGQQLRVLMEMRDELRKLDNVGRLGR